MLAKPAGHRDWDVASAGVVGAGVGAGGVGGRSWALVDATSTRAMTRHRSAGEAMDLLTKAIASY
jgi:hypothetical protein